MKDTRMNENKDVACYFVTKHSWKGKYKRIFSVGDLGITTYSPNSMETTNQWPYKEFVNIAPNTRTHNEFIITMKKGKKMETMKFSSDHRADILTEALKFKNHFAEPISVIQSYNALKYHWSGSNIPVVLDVTPASLDQIDPRSRKLLASYNYKDIEELYPLSKPANAFVIVYGGFGRKHLFISDQRDEVMKKVTETAATHIGISLKVLKDNHTLNDFVENRFGSYSSDESLTSICDFIVHKLSPRHEGPVKRLLCLTDTCLLERDPGTYSITTLRPLSEIFSLIRCPNNPQKFHVEYVKGQIRTYTSSNRDAILASLLDGVRASGNKDIHVKMKFTARGQRLGPLTGQMDEEVESNHLKFLQISALPPGWDFAEAVSRFNNNIPYSGLLHSITQDGLFSENKEKLITGALSSLLENEGDQDNIPLDVQEAQFQAIHRLVASKIGFAAFTEIPKFREKLGVKVVKALRRNNEGVAHAAIDMLCALMQPMHDEYDLRQEQLNKTSLLSTKGFLESLLDMMVKHINSGTGALFVASMLDFLTFALCTPYSETTDGHLFDTLLNLVAEHGRALFQLFQHPSLAIVKGAGLVMKAIIEEGEAEVAQRMQELSLGEGALPRHLHIALFTPKSDSRMLALLQLSRNLVTLWVTGHSRAMDLISRILPVGLLRYLDSKEKVPSHALDKFQIRDNLKMAQDHAVKNQKLIHPSLKVVEKHLEHALQHWRARIGLEPKKDDKALQQRPIVLRKHRQRIKSEANWDMLYYQFYQDHAQPDLIWNFRTREELKDALEDEMHKFNMDIELSRNVLMAWNDVEFEVRYPSLQEEIRVGDYYLRLLLEEDDKDHSGISSAYITKPFEFFNDLYHRFLLAQKVALKCMCLHAMAIVYGKYVEEIGPFNDTRFIVHMLDRCSDRLERDRLILFIEKLILHKRNIKDLIDANGLKTLVDLITLAHLHTSRAVVPTQTNVIEASPDMQTDTEKEWYYRNADKERFGPYTFEEMKELYTNKTIHLKTLCWAQGMDGWRSLISVPQLKWTLVATGAPLMNESDLASHILSILIDICRQFPSRDSKGAVIRPIPRAKYYLSDSSFLPHVVQLLLTFDPILVEKVALLVEDIMRDNPNMSRLYHTGFFYFILMYTGSNVLPIGRLLKASHLSQAFRAEDAPASSIMQRSILGQMLPEAMVCYLENHGPEKFAEIFLGEFDTPEAIWNNEMRRMMIEKIAVHLADFTPRLRSNTRALYTYCAIPIIQYPQLENELFCNIFYLRHLCDSTRFPDWPIPEPLKLLKDVLEAWKQEIEKKPSTLTVDDAYEALNLARGQQHEESKIRKAYFRLAQQYHPDKNPEGREIFEMVNKAYEFLCSRSSRVTEGPDPINIMLILKTQSILFKRYKEELHPYRYSGYPMLIQTIQMESKDEQLFSKSAPLLAAAAETCFHTVNCSSLNVEELRREGGLEVLKDAFIRCVGVLSKSSTPESLPVQVCGHIARCFAVASQFSASRARLVDMPDMVRELCRILYYKHLSKLCSMVVETISAFAVDEVLQMQLFQAGVLYHLLTFFFQYDFTLEESGVEKAEDTNQQEVANQLARLSLIACARLGGYIEKTPPNIAVRRALDAMLTHYIVEQFTKAGPSEILKLLNCNTENPYLIWNNGTRAELLEYVKRQRDEKIRSGECDPTLGAEFKYTAYEDELIIGDIFVRIYNQMPSFPLENARGFTLDLLDYLGSQAQYLHSLLSLTQNGDALNNNTAPSTSPRLHNIEMALEALKNVILNNPGVEIQCIGHFKLLFSLLRMDTCPRVQAYTIQAVAGVTGNQECVKDIASSDVLVYLLLVLHSFHDSSSQSLILETLIPLMANGKLVKDAMNKGIVIYVLDLFCNASNPRIRELSAELLGKMMADKLHGPKVRIDLGKFLPPLFLDAMREFPATAVQLFEGTQENPELIWNDDARENLSSIVAQMANEHYAIQRDDPTALWSCPQESILTRPEHTGELMVGGVYVRLFVQTPTYVVRRPREFLAELLDKLNELTNSRGSNVDEVLELVSQAAVCLLQAQPSLLDVMPAMGHIPRLLKVMHTSTNGNVVQACLRIVHELASNEACIKAMAQVDCIGPLMKAIQRREDLISVACEALNRMFQSANDDLSQQAIEAKLVNFLLEKLESKLEVANPSATKAQIVQALTALSLSSRCGEQVQAILEKSAIWAEYKDQKHDLFISDSSVSGYLTGGTPGVAGYLTQGNTRSMPSSPPPIEES